jgi:pimeloyl-ACP methyl ester carboxylesterase
VPEPSPTCWRLARVQRESATPEVAARALEAFYEADVTGMLSSVECPALVLHYTGDRAVPYRAGEEVAALLPDARLVPLDGIAHLPVEADLDTITDVIEDFIGPDGAG